MHIIAEAIKRAVQSTDPPLSITNLIYKVVTEEVQEPAEA